MHCLKCEGISRCIFCVGLEGAMLMLFNTPVAASRFDEVWQTLAAWHPDFTTAQELKTKYGDGEWAQTTALAKIAVISEEG